MIPRWASSLVVVFALGVVLGAVVWGIDRIGMVHWIGATNLDMDFIVTAAESGEPIPEARIEIHSEIAFYDGADEDRDIELRGDADGLARRQCRGNTCIGTRSGLRFTDTYHVYIPGWIVRALAGGYEPSPMVYLAEVYRGKVHHEGPAKDRLVVRISLRKAAAEPDAVPQP